MVLLTLIRYHHVNNFKLTLAVQMTGKALWDLLCLGSGVISWATNKQLLIALLSSEAEYIVTNSEAYQVMWLRRFLCDLKEKQDKPTTLHCDMSTIAVTKKKIELSWEKQPF